MLRFFIALWASKLVMWVNKLRGNERDDWPGLLAYKLCPRFLEYIKKPNLVITITGTNGKTTTANLVNDKLVESGYTVSHNDWGANLYAGFALNLMRCVNIFNKSIKDASVLEADELTSDETMPMIKPNYVLVTNICKDSLRRNGHPENIFNHLETMFQKLDKETVAILNANDPISSNLASGCKRIYFGMSDTGENPLQNIVKDVQVCPICGGHILYDYRLYRHIGKFYCDGCTYGMPRARYFVEGVDYEKREMTVSEEGKITTYPLISDTVFNAYNVLGFVSLMREVGFSERELVDFLSHQKVTEFRETVVEYNGIKYYTYGTKSQNVSAASTVFEHMSKEPTTKNLVFLLDEVQDKNHPTETITWLYETDYEFLKSPTIKKIIVGGHMFLNHKLRLLLAGVNPEKIVCVENEEDIVEHVDRKDIDSVYVLFEIDYVTKAKNMRDKIVDRARKAVEYEKN